MMHLCISQQFSYHCYYNFIIIITFFISDRVAVYYLVRLDYYAPFVLQGDYLDKSR